TSCFDTSPWVEDLERLVRRAIGLRKPVFGICFGHQLLARILGGHGCLRASVEPEVGWTEIRVSGRSLLFHGLPERFHSFSFHYEELANLPKDLRAVSSSKRCAFQAFEAEDAPVFG